MMEMPELPPGLDAFAVTKDDGTETYAVSIPDAAHLIGRSETFLRTWIKRGIVAICQHPVHGRLVLVDSLWAALPDEVRA